jgi:antitoxin component YwqK of YwqJK toxin-antitoxin module
MKKQNIFIVIVCILLISCNKTKEEKTPDGKLIKKYEYYEDDNGSIIKNGDYQTWYKNEIIEFVGEYKENKRYGNWKKWNKDNIQIAEFNYINGLLDGEYKLFNDKGILKSISIYKNDSLNGLKTKYDEDGNITTEIEYLSNSFNGETINYSNKQITSKRYFEKGIPVGQWEFFEIDNKLPFNLNFIKGCPKEFIGKWKVNNKRSTYMEFFENGKIKYTYPKYKRKSSYDPKKTENLKYTFGDRYFVFKDNRDELSGFYTILEINKDKIRLSSIIEEDEIIISKM